MENRLKGDKNWYKVVSYENIIVIVLEMNEVSLVGGWYEWV